LAASLSKRKPAWRDAIIELASNTPVRLKMAKQGRDWVERRFSALVIWREFEALLASDKQA